MKNILKVLWMLGLAISLICFNSYAQEIEEEEPDDLILEEEGSSDDLMNDETSEPSDSGDGLIGEEEKSNAEQQETKTEEKTQEPASTETSASTSLAMDKKQLKSNKKTFLKSLKADIKKYKKMTPEEIVAIQEDLENAKTAMEKAESELRNCNAKMDMLKREVSTLKSQMEAAQQEITRLKEAPPVLVTTTEPIPGKQGTTGNTQTASSKGTTSSSGGGSVSSAGIVFKVQLGAYQQFDLNKSTIGDQKVEVDNLNGWKKYTAGSFKSYQEAANFKESVSKMGIADAFIVAYKNGSRVDIKTAVAEMRQ